MKHANLPASLGVIVIALSWQNALAQLHSDYDDDLPIESLSCEVGQSAISSAALQYRGVLQKEATRLPASDEEGTLQTPEALVLLHDANTSMHGDQLHNGNISLHEDHSMNEPCLLHRMAALLARSRLPMKSTLSAYGDGSMLVAVALLVLLPVVAALTGLYCLHASKGGGGPAQRGMPAWPFAKTLTRSASPLASGTSLTSDDLDSLDGTGLGNSLGGMFGEALVVSQPAGVSLVIEGPVLPYEQTGVVGIRLLADTEGAQPGEILRMMFAELGQNKGILLETASGVALAYVDTTNAVRPRSGKHSSAKGAASVVLSQIPIENRSLPIPWAVVKEEMYREDNGRESPSHVFTATRITRDGSAGEVLAKCGRLSNFSGSFDVISPDGRINAKVEKVPHNAPEESSKRMIRIGQGVDSCLMICMALAMSKLP